MYPTRSYIVCRTLLELYTVFVTRELTKLISKNDVFQLWKRVCVFSVTNMHAKNIVKNRQYTIIFKLFLFVCRANVVMYECIIFFFFCKIFNSCNGRVLQTCQSRIQTNRNGNPNAIFVGEQSIRAREMIAPAPRTSANRTRSNVNRNCNFVSRDDDDIARVVSDFRFTPLSSYTRTAAARLEYIVRALNVLPRLPFRGPRPSPVHSLRPLFRPSPPPLVACCYGFVC